MAIINFDYLNDDYEDFRIKLNQISQLFGDGANLPLNEPNLVSAMNRIVNTQNAAPAIAVNVLQEFTLNAGVTVDGVLIKDNSLFPQSLEIQSNNPSLFIKDNDGILNEKFFTLNNNSKVLSVSILNDNKLDKKDFIQFHRSGNNISDIRVFSDFNMNSNVLSFRNNGSSSIKSATSLDHIWFEPIKNIFHFTDSTGYKTVGNSTIQSNSLFLYGVLPSVKLFDNTQSTDNKKWNVVSKNRSFILQSLNDAEDSSKDILEIQRNFLNSPEAIFRGESFRVKANGAANIVLDSSLGNNSIISFIENSQSRVNSFFDRANDEFTTEKKSIVNGSITNYIKLNDFHVESLKDFYFNRRSLISNYNTSSNVNPELSNSVDCIWNSNTQVTSVNGNLLGTWHFQNSTSYKNSGNSLIKAGGANLDLWLELWNKVAPANNGKYRFVSRSDSKFSLYLQNDISTTQAEVFTVNRSANSITSFDIFGLLKVNTINHLSGSNGVTISSTRLLNSTILCNTINEWSANNGVTIDGVTLKDGNVNIGGGNVIQSTHNVNIVLDIDDNSDSSFNIYKTSYAEGSNIFKITESGIVNINSLNGGSILNISDSDAATATLANPVIAFYYQDGIGTTRTRLGYIGYGSTSNDSLYVLNDTGALILSGTNISLNSSSLDLNVPISSDLFITNIIYEKTSNSGVSIDGSLIKDGNFETIGSNNYFGGVGDLNLLVDSNGNGNNTFKIFAGSVNTANQLMVLTENGDLSIISRSGSDMLNLIDIAANDTASNPYMSFSYSTSVGASANRIGVVGFTSTTDKHLRIINSTTGDIKLEPDSGIVEVTNGKTLKTALLDVVNVQSANGQVISTWCTFNGNGTPDIIGSHNISSITKNSVGNYTLNFTNPLPNDAYCVSVCGDFSLGVYQVANPYVSSVTIRARRLDGSFDDPTRIYVTINCKE